MGKKRAKKQQPTTEEKARNFDNRLKSYAVKSAISMAEEDLSVKKQVLAQILGIKFLDEDEIWRKKLLATIDEAAVKKINENPDYASNIADRRIRQLMQEWGLIAEGEEWPKRRPTLDDMLENFKKVKELEECGIKPGDPLIRGVRYDVWHKPGISPKKLTQGDSKKFVETGEYMGEEFNVTEPGKDQPLEDQPIFINGEPAEVTTGAKEGTFAIRETPEMFGTRLLADISERPEFYFARREISRTDPELQAFEWDIYNMYKTARSMNKNNRWWTNEHSCENKLRCPYIPVCYNRIDVSDGSVPEGFKCIFTKGKENAGTNS